ncbi:PAS domain-containing sensor histidine kinase [Mucilaginibacter koreensis]
MPDILAPLFETLGACSADVYFVYQINERRFIYLSPAFEQVWGQPEALVKNQPALLLPTICEEDRAYVMHHYQQALQDRQEHKLDFRIQKPDQSTAYIDLSLSVADNEQAGLVVAGIAKDITTLRTNILYAEKINARKNSMLEILSHDLKEPMGIMRMMASAIQQDARTAGNEAILQSAKMIEDLCKRNIDLIRELLKQEFLESPEVDLRKERADIVWHLTDMIDNYKRSADVLHKQFVITSNTEKLFMQVDTLKIIQSFNNLIANSTKFTYDNGIISIHIEDQDPWVIIIVTDNGIGIPVDLQPYLFDKFTRARRPGLHGEETTGLGMSIIKTIIELHGGSIWLKSEENKGCTFFIKLPKT